MMDADMSPDKRSSLKTPGQGISVTIGVPVEIDYTNHRGERCLRNVIPTGRLLPGDPKFHPHAPWVIEAFDPAKGGLRTFDPDHLHRWGDTVRWPRSAPEVTWATVRQIADDPRVLAVYAAPEFDELSDDGKAWTKALVEVAFAVTLAAAKQHTRADMAAGDPLTAREQRDQAYRCSCAGADDLCTCQNVPDMQTRARRASRAETPGDPA